MAIQTDYARDPAIGKPGLLARPDLPFWVVVGTTQIDASERAPRPGDAVIRDNTTGVNAFKIPSSTELADICGIVAHRDQEIPRTNVAGTTDAVQYLDGEQIYVLTYGVVYVRVETGASETITYGDRMVWDPPSAITDDADWEELPATTTALAAGSNVTVTVNHLRAQPKLDIVAANVVPVAASTDTVIPVKVGMGRV